MLSAVRLRVCLANDRVPGLRAPGNVGNGARLCENLGSQIARRRSFSISVSLKNERTDGRHRGKTIEKTMLRVLGSCTFSHSLGQQGSTCSHKLEASKNLAVSAGL